MTRRRRRAIAAATLLTCATPFGVAQAQEEKRKQDNKAAATIEQDGGRAFDFKWSLRRESGELVDNHNVANAAARCTDCRATAIAFQIVLVSGSPAKILPKNQAVAINDACTRCVVYAGARQFVRTIGSGGAKFTGDGNSTLADVRKVLRALEGQDLTVAQQQAEVERQEVRVIKVLTTQVVSTKGKRTKLSRPDNNQADDS